ncbi:11892_t:CDS:2, partial [Ambispora leptoticha]
SSNSWKTTASTNNFTTASHSTINIHHHNNHTLSPDVLAKALQQSDIPNPDFTLNSNPAASNFVDGQFSWASDAYQQTIKKRKLSAASATPKPYDSKVPRPPNAFIIYHRTKSKELAQYKSNNLRVTSDARHPSKTVAEMWKEEPEHVKLQYQREADLALVEHKRKYPFYKYKPQKKDAKNKGKSKDSKSSSTSKDSKSSSKLSSKVDKSQIVPFEHRQQASMESAFTVFDTNPIEIKNESSKEENNPPTTPVILWINDNINHRFSLNGEQSTLTVHSFSYPLETEILSTSLREQSSVYASPLPSPVGQESFFPVQLHQEEPFVENPYLMDYVMSQLQDTDLLNTSHAFLQQHPITTTSLPPHYNQEIKLVNSSNDDNILLTPSILQMHNLHRWGITITHGLSSSSNQLDSTGVLINNLTQQQHLSTKSSITQQQIQHHIQLMHEAESLQDSFLRGVRLQGTNNGTHVQHPISHSQHKLIRLVLFLTGRL